MLSGLFYVRGIRRGDPPLIKQNKNGVLECFFQVVWPYTRYTKEGWRQCYAFRGCTTHSESWFPLILEASESKYKMLDMDLQPLDYFKDGRWHDWYQVMGISGPYVKSVHAAVVEGEAGTGGSDEEDDETPAT